MTILLLASKVQITHPPGNQTILTNIMIHFIDSTPNVILIAPEILMRCHVHFWGVFFFICPWDNAGRFRSLFKSHMVNGGSPVEWLHHWPTVIHGIFALSIVYKKNDAKYCQNRIILWNFHEFPFAKNSLRQNLLEIISINFKSNYLLRLGRSSSVKALLKPTMWYATRTVASRNAACWSCCNPNTCQSSFLLRELRGSANRRRATLRRHRLRVLHIWNPCCTPVLSLTRTCSARCIMQVLLTTGVCFCRSQISWPLGTKSMGLSSWLFLYASLPVHLSCSSSLSRLPKDSLEE